MVDALSTVKKTLKVHGKLSLIELCVAIIAEPK